MHPAATYAEHLRAHADELRRSRAFENYEAVRSRVLRWKDVNGGTAETASPSKYWEEELVGFDYMFDASPLIVAKLRHHCYHLTGLRPYDYRSNKDRARDQLAAKLDALRREGNPGLLVPEDPRLGGFGFELDGALYNVDTLKFFEAMIALEKGAVLEEIRGQAERKLVWEIGAGWGGFARVFKHLCPNTTFVIIDLPEVLLFSGTYLMTTFPDAHFVFQGDRPGDELLSNWEEADFVLMPHTALDEFRPPQLDLTINMVSFQEMTTSQVEAYVQYAAGLDSRYLYSLNRDRSLYNTEIESVHHIINTYFWPHRVDVLPAAYTKMGAGVDLKSRAKKLKDKRPGQQPTNEYRHVVGWRRVQE